jgi:hypothetical protein
MGKEVASLLGGRGDGFDGHGGGGCVSVRPRSLPGVVGLVYVWTILAVVNLCFALSLPGVRLVARTILAVNTGLVPGLFNVLFGVRTQRLLPPNDELIY